jgi:hypothetical protein
LILALEVTFMHVCCALAVVLAYPSLNSSIGRYIVIMFGVSKPNTLSSRYDPSRLSLIHLLNAVLHYRGTRRT